MKRKFKPWLYVAGVLLMSASCKKETEPQIEGFVCDDGTCCNPELVGMRYRQIRTLEGALAALSCGNIDCSLIFKDKIREPRLDNLPFEKTAWTRQISICPVTEHLVKGLSAYYYADQSQDSLQYNYRVWGKVYENIDARPFVYPDYDFSLERIERIP